MAKDVRALGDFERQIKKLRKNRHNLTSDYKDFVVNLEASYQQWDRVKDVGDAPLCAYAEYKVCSNEALM